MIFFRLHGLIFIHATVSLHSSLLICSPSHRHHFNILIRNSTSDLCILWLLNFCSFHCFSSILVLSRCLTSFLVLFKNFRGRSRLLSLFLCHSHIIFFFALLSRCRTEAHTQSALLLFWSFLPLAPLLVVQQCLAAVRVIIHWLIAIRLGAARRNCLLDRGGLGRVCVFVGGDVLCYFAPTA